MTARKKLNHLQGRTLKVVVSALLGAFLMAKPALAAFSFSIKEINKQTINNKEEEIEVILTINELPSESYFRVAFQQESGKPYFGFIKNDKNEWTKIGSLGGNCENYYYVADTEITDLIIYLIIGNENEVENTEYSIKGHRFTASCSSYKESENTKTINFNLPIPTPSPKPSPSPTPTPTPTPSPSPSPNPSPLPSPSGSDPEGEPTRRVLVNEELMLLASRAGEVKGASKSTEASASGKNKTALVIAVVLITGGLGLVGGSGVVLYKQQRYNKNNDKKT